MSTSNTQITPPPPPPRGGPPGGGQPPPPQSGPQRQPIKITQLTALAQKISDITQDMQDPYLIYLMGVDNNNNNKISVYSKSNEQQKPLAQGQAAPPAALTHLSTMDAAGIKSTLPTSIPPDLITLYSGAPAAAPAAANAGGGGGVVPVAAAPAPGNGNGNGNGNGGGGGVVPAGGVAVGASANQQPSAVPVSPTGNVPISSNASSNVSISGNASIFGFPPGAGGVMALNSSNKNTSARTIFPFSNTASYTPKDILLETEVYINYIDYYDHVYAYKALIEYLAKYLTQDKLDNVKHDVNTVISLKLEPLENKLTTLPDSMEKSKLNTNITQLQNIINDFNNIQGVAVEETRKSIDVTQPLSLYESYINKIKASRASIFTNNTEKFTAYQRFIETIAPPSPEATLPLPTNAPDDPFTDVAVRIDALFLELYTHHMPNDFTQERYDYIHYEYNRLHDRYNELLKPPKTSGGRKQKTARRRRKVRSTKRVWRK